MSTQKSRSTKTLIDPFGKEVAAKYLPKYDLKRDAVAKAILRDFLKAREMLERVKERSIARIRDLQEEAAKDTNVKPLGGPRGNIQFRSFDGSIIIRYDADYKTAFDERLALAQQLINEAIAESAEGAENPDLIEIATRAFQPRRTGRLDMQRIRELCTYRVSHPKWKQAVEIIKKCERTVGTKNYLRVAVRQSRDQKPKPITLNIAEV